MTSSHGLVRRRMSSLVPTASCLRLAPATSGLIFTGAFLYRTLFDALSRRHGHAAISLSLSHTHTHMHSVEGSVRRVGYTPKLGSGVSHIDWSGDGTMVQVRRARTRVGV